MLGDTTLPAPIPPRGFGLVEEPAGPDQSGLEAIYTTAGNPHGDIKQVTRPSRLWLPHITAIFPTTGDPEGKVATSLAVRHHGGEQYQEPLSDPRVPLVWTMPWRIKRRETACFGSRRRDRFATDGPGS